MTTEETIDFETAFAGIEEILEKINGGSLSLEESLRLYEEADRLISVCQTKLTQAETKIETIIKNREGKVAVNESGTPITRPFSSMSASESS